MLTENLYPDRVLLGQEYVLVQAWKKTAAYIRYHNWFSDTLALDRAAVDLPNFLANIRARLDSSGVWKNDPLRLVPAPKTQRWSAQNGKWGPVEGPASARLRPLAHVSFADQVISTGVMLCLADRVETLQGDPRTSIDSEQARRRVISYGNRLFCDSVNGALSHRWGASKLYRAYYEDYRTFLSRPEVVAKELLAENDVQVFVVHADLKQFYDRVRPELLHAALDAIRQPNDDSEFFNFAKSLLDWRWHPRDLRKEVGIYAEQAGLERFDEVALPQGLVASGFFANIVLLPFDGELQQGIGAEIEGGVRVADACRYVDDLRVTVAIRPDSELNSESVKESVCKWLNDLLTSKANGLALSAEKTKVAAFDGDERPLVRQSTRMNRIQAGVSGGFDVLAGEEILDAVQGLMRAQTALSVTDESGWRLSPVPDVRDETVARFGAARFRATFRSIRPLLESEDESSGRGEHTGTTFSGGSFLKTRTQTELDEDVRAFALGLIESWVQDPSNVRLLRIGLDLWPDAEVLQEVLSLLRPFTERRGRRKAPRRVAWYCLSEILRAGATETGLVADAESLPMGVDVQAYRRALTAEAARLVELPAATIPWYLRQQALLYLAAADPGRAPVVRSGSAAETRIYRDLIRFQRGESNHLNSSEFAVLAILSRRAFVDRSRALEVTQKALNAARVTQIAERDLSFILELLEGDAGRTLADNLTARAREDLSLNRPTTDYELLSEAVLREHPKGGLRNELGLLRFAREFLCRWQQEEAPPEVVPPGLVALRREDDAGISRIAELCILRSRVAPSGSIYQSPEWCEPSQRWRFHLAFLMRFILSGQPDFTQMVRPAHWKESQAAYRAPGSHWYQRLYGSFSGQSAFGDDWLPISDWTERFLLALLRWPGCRAPEGFSWVEAGIDQVLQKIGARIAKCEEQRGHSTGELFMPLIATRPNVSTDDRPLRACIVQTAIPAGEDFNASDLTLDHRAVRKKHRNHLSAALAAVERMLALRKTHKGSDGRLDWLILPELAVHPNDVGTHLIPFARAHRAMILAGMTYERLIPGQPLINSALWIIPEWSAAHGLQIKIRRQGKAYLAQEERVFNTSSTQIHGFRPCQWLIGYPWSREHRERPLWLTAAICYDATDLSLAADLRDRSDIMAIPALNKDVKTFDQMALALHYHMFQLVIVANNGQYGGSNAYWPLKDKNMRQVFHLHGQPQASIAFLEINDIGELVNRRNEIAGSPVWKHPPAGMGG